MGQKRMIRSRITMAMKKVDKDLDTLDSWSMMSMRPVMPFGPWDMDSARCVWGVCANVKIRSDQGGRLWVSDVEKCNIRLVTHHLSRNTGTWWWIHEGIGVCVRPRWYVYKTILTRFAWKAFVDSHTSCFVSFFRLQC